MPTTTPSESRPESFWGYLSRTHGRLWFLQRPRLWWSASARLVFAVTQADPYAAFQKGASQAQEQVHLGDIVDDSMSGLHRGSRADCAVCDD